MKQIPGQMSLLDIIMPKNDKKLQKTTLNCTKPTQNVKPCFDQDFSQYIGKCEFCRWYRYNLDKKEKEEGRLNCMWERDKVKAFRCENGSRWKPGERKIPGLCTNCAHSNMFEYQAKDEYKGVRGAKPWKDPVDEPNIYCTRYGGSVNRRQVYKDFWETGFGFCQWDRQHEWDTCDAWRSDGWKLKEEGKDG